MMKKIIFLFSLLGVTSLSCRASAKEYFPDGQEITEWFYEVKPVKLEDLGKQYLLTDHGIFADGNRRACRSLSDRRTLLPTWHTSASA